MGTTNEPSTLSAKGAVSDEMVERACAAYYNFEGGFPLDGQTGWRNMSSWPDNSEYTKEKRAAMRAALEAALNV